MDLILRVITLYALLHYMGDYELYLILTPFETLDGLPCAYVERFNGRENTNGL